MNGNNENNNNENIEEKAGKNRGDINKPSFSLISKNKNSKSKVAIYIIGCLLVISVSAAAFYVFKDKFFTSEPKNKQQILNSSLEATSNAKSSNFSGNVKYNFTAPSNKKGSEFFEKLSVDVKFDGRGDYRDKKNPKAYYNIKPYIDITAEGGSQSVYFDLDVISYSRDIVYLRLNDYDLGLAGMMLGSAISPYKGNWYVLDLKKMEESTTRQFRFDKITKLSGKYEFLKFKEDLGDSVINGIDVYHYKAAIDGEAVVDFYKDILTEMSSSIKKSGRDGNINNSTEIDKTIDEIEKYRYVISDIVNRLNVEIWIGKKDNFIYKEKINGELDEEFFKTLMNKMAEAGDISKSDLNNAEKIGIGRFSFEANINTKDYNKPVEISKPDNAQDLMKIFESAVKEKYFGKQMNGPKIIPPEVGVDSKEDKDKDGLPDFMEELYGTDKNNPDTDGDGYKDGEEVKNGYDPTIPGSARLW